MSKNPPLIDIEFIPRQKRRRAERRHKMIMRTLDFKKLRDNTLPVFRPHLFDFTTRVEAFLGSRLSGKTIFTCKRLDFYMNLFDGVEILVIRKVQGDILESIFKTMKKVFSEGDYKDQYKIQDKKIIHIATGGTITYKGMDDPVKVKGFDTANIIFIEEAEQIDEEDFRTLTTTLRANPLKSICEKYTLLQKLILLQNPSKDFHHWTKKLYHSILTKHGHKITEGLSKEDVGKAKIAYKVKACHSTAEDNPHLTQEMKDNISNLKHYNINAYKRDWQGRYAQLTEAIILPLKTAKNPYGNIRKLTRKEFNYLWAGWTNEDNDKWENGDRSDYLKQKRKDNHQKYRFQGCDYSEGVGADPMTVIDVKIFRRDGDRPLILVNPLLCNNMLKSHDAIYKALEKAGVDKYIKTYADSANNGKSGSITEQGYDFEGGYKTNLEERPDSLKRFEIGICDDGTDLNNKLIDELDNWALQEDKKGNILAIPNEGNDHFIDPINYIIDSIERDYGQIFSKFKLKITEVA